jgi:hypothetical protein
MNELAQFEYLVVLTIHVCRLRTKRAKLFKGATDYWLAARRMRNERQRLGLSWSAPFQIKFIHFPCWAPLWNPNDYWAINYDNSIGASTILYSRKDSEIFHKLAFWRASTDDRLDGQILEMRKSIRQLSSYEYLTRTARVTRRRSSDASGTRLQERSRPSIR